MSALLAPLDDLAPLEAPATRPSAGSRTHLRSVQVNPMRASRAVFIGVLLAILGIGMVGVLLLNTTIQQRSAQVSAAQRTADDLAARNATLTSQVEQLRSSSALATQAWQLGLRPNPYPVFIQLGAAGQPGHIIGDPTKVTGSEMPDQQFTSADDVTVAITKARQAALAAKAAQQKTSTAPAQTTKTQTTKTQTTKTQTTNTQTAGAAPASTAPTTVDATQNQTTQNRTTQNRATQNQTGQTAAHGTTKTAGGH